MAWIKKCYATLLCKKSNAKCASPLTLPENISIFSKDTVNTVGSNGTIRTLFSKDTQNTSADGYISLKKKKKTIKKGQSHISLENKKYR